MQTIFIEENLNHQQIIDLCKLIELNNCKSLEFRRCTIPESDFDELIKSLSNNGKSIISLIFNIQMLNEQNRFKKFSQMLSNCSNLVNLRVHGNNINDDMFTQLYSTLYEHCPKLSLLDIGDNILTNKSIVNLCSLIIPDTKRIGLEELILSANRLITNVGWTELFFSISFNSRIRRLALDYNILDNTIAAMLSMVIASSRTLTYLDLECCNLSEYAGQLFLTLFTKYPVKLQEICLEKNVSILQSTRTLINECLNLKFRENSISNEHEHLLIEKLSINDDSTSTNSTINEPMQPIKLRKKKKKTNLKKPSVINSKEEIKSVQIKLPTETKKQEKKEEDDIEELLPVEIEPHGTIGRTLYWNRI